MSTLIEPSVDRDGGPTEHLARFAAEISAEQIPTDAVTGARLSILDTLGVGLAALTQPIARELLAHITELGGTPAATLIGAGGVRTSAPMAALGNGALMNLLDYDGLWHIPTYVLATALATGELAGVDGQTVLEAFIVGTEVAERLRAAIDALRDQGRGPTYRGWYHVSVYGPIAAAATAGRVFGLDTVTMRAAMSIAVNGGGGVRQNLGTSAKSLLSGNPGSHGVHAALLARRGLSGDPEILEARVGLVRALCLPGECDWAAMTDGLGERWVLSHGPDIKRFPAVGPTQPVIASLQRLREREPFDADEVIRVRARLSSFSAGVESPSDPLEAGFRWPYVLAATIADGSFGVDHLTTERIADPRIAAIAQRLEFVQVGPTDEESITVTLRDGGEVSTTVDGAPEAEHSASVVLAKFRDCARRHLGPDGADELERAVGALGKVDGPDAAALAGLLT